MARRTKTFSEISGAIGDELQPRRASFAGETGSGVIPRSASQGVLVDQFSLKAAFDNLAKSPAISLEALPGMYNRVSQEKWEAADVVTCKLCYEQEIYI